MTSVLLPPPPPATARVPGRYEVACWARQAHDLRLAYPPDGVVPRDPRQTQHPLGLWFSPGAAEHSVRFIETTCKHYKGEWAGRPLLLSDWQRTINRIVFGWMRPDDSRRFRIAYIEVPRKNGKSTWVAPLGIYLMLADREPGSEVYASATKRAQAGIVFDAATAMVRASPGLHRHIKIYRNNLSVPRTNSKFEPLGADSDRLDGLSPHGNLIDELHAHRDRKLWDVLDTGMGARRQPLTIAITTAGVYRPESIGYGQHQHAAQVLDGVLADESYFAFIAAADPDLPWRDEATWRTANPNYGVSVKPEYLAQQAAQAEMQPSFLNSFLRFHLNRWTAQAERWLDIDRWRACDVDCTRAEMVAREAALAGRECYAGLDISSRLDISALVLVFPLGEGCANGIELVCRFWIPDSKRQAAAQGLGLGDRVPYDAWARDGWLATTPGEVVQQGYLRAELNALGARYRIRELAFDPWNASELMVQLQEDGWSTDPRADTRLLVSVPQMAKHLSEPSKRFEELLTRALIRHGGHPVLRWNVANVAKREDANGNIAPDKKTSSGRIDGVTATINALSRAIVTTPVDDSPWLLMSIPLVPRGAHANREPT